MKRIGRCFVAMAVALLVLFYWNVNTGSVALTPGEVLELLLLKRGDAVALRIVWDIRLPRMLAAAILGGALSVSGFLLQSFFGNPIAGPYILGISSGAKLVVALTMIFFLGRGMTIGSIHMIGAAFVGAMLAMGFVLLFSTRTHKMSLLIVCGVMIGYICSAITDFVVTFADDANIVNLHNWSMGSFSGTTWSNVSVMTVVIILTLFVTFFLAKPMAAYQLGEAYARNAGVNIRGLRVMLILLSSLLSACVTAFAGPISFVGIAVPHLVKVMTGKARPLIMLPGCFLMGAVVTLFCDGIARTVFAPTELSISSVTAVLLVPVVIWMMLKRQGGR
ncbi:MAG: iron ABC transporter permease [Lachnospiraceae bacterium]|nr:iron ABC transporter permease [Lachnospiraceae bacterium]